jgi:hypothetical protein
MPKSGEGTGMVDGKRMYRVIECRKNKEIWCRDGRETGMVSIYIYGQSDNNNNNSFCFF